MSLAEDFDGFWLCYPRREARLNAFKAYTKARKLASAADILAGVERYKLTMPEERQFRPLPASWLNAGRWMDEDDAPVITKPAYSCPHVPACEAGFKEWCITRQWSDKQRGTA